jgi:sialate O-acetylesterase
MKKISLCVFCVMMLIAHASIAIRLPKIYSDHMVLQREKPLKIWGWGTPGETVKVVFNGQSVQAKAGKNGAWSVMLKPMQHGGPFEMKLSAKSGDVLLKNILIGDVWLGSGQSNMEWILRNTQNAEAEIAAANFPKIRLFTVEKDLSFKTKDDLKSGQWMECTSKNAADFSAVAYHFGKILSKELDIPIGLINSSWGGTKVEPWISWELMNQEPEYKNLDLSKFESMAKENEAKQRKYAEAMRNDRGAEEKWFLPETSTDGWKPINLPQEWSGTEIGNTDGIVWFRKEFNLENADLDSARLSLGAIDDIDFTYINGTLVGSERLWNKARFYPVAKNLLKAGKNIIVVKVQDDQGGGGLVGKPEQLYLQVGTKRVALDGEWLYKTSVLTSDFNLMDVGPNAFPSQLYNAMIAPIVDYKIRGVIWYQGESNTYAAFNYKRLFPMLINNWRQKWGYEFPFYWVQLANFMAPSLQPGESQWAELREAQRITLTLPKTGQAVIIDIGEADDIHPRNKKDVGYRLALNALAGEYGKKIEFSGPQYKSMEKQGDRLILTFDHADSGLEAWKNKYGYLSGFTIAGEDGKFDWARAFVENGKVVVYSPKVKNPVAVRYAWSDNPGDANLYNKEGLPASPFKTDSWKWVTEPK